MSTNSAPRPAGDVRANSGNVTITIPARVYGRLATVADKQGKSIADLLTETIKTVIDPPKRRIAQAKDSREQRILDLVMIGAPDCDISVVLGETVSHIAAVRRRAGIYRTKPKQPTDRKAEAA